MSENKITNEEEKEEEERTVGEKNECPKLVAKRNAKSKMKCYKIEEAKQSKQK